MNHSEKTLFEQIGGAETVAQLIDQFYDRVLGDEELAPFFEQTSMDRLPSNALVSWTRPLAPESCVCSINPRSISTTVK